MYNQSDNSIMTNPLQSINPQELEKQLNNPYVNGGVEITYSSNRPATAYNEKQLLSQTQNVVHVVRNVFSIKSNRPLKQPVEIPLLVIQPNNSTSPERTPSSF